MRGTTRRRGPTWSAVYEAGDQLALICPTCSTPRRPRLWWQDARPPETCPDCGGQLVAETKRRQIAKGGFRTQGAAQTWLDQQKVGLRTGDHVEPSRITLAAFLTGEGGWLETVKTKVRPGTYAGYKGHVDAHLVPLLGSVKLQALSVRAIEGAYVQLQSEGRGRTSDKRGRKGLSATTVRRVHVTLHQALKMAAKRGLVARNAADYVTLPRAKPGEVPEMVCWSADEVRAFLASVEADRLHPLWRVLTHTGLRRGEALGLRWADVTFMPPEEEDGQETARLSIRHTLVAVGYEIQESEPKTNRGRRTVPLDVETTAVLRAWADRQADEAATAGGVWAGGDYVFTREDGSPLHPDEVTRTFDRLVKAALVPRIRLHDVRHTYATRMLEAGVSPKVVSELLGHSSVSFTIDRYSHAIPSMQESAVAMLARLYA